MSFNAVDKDGHVVATGVSCRYALSTSPRAARYITDKDGYVLAVALGGVAWVPTTRGMGVVTEAAMQIGWEQMTVQYTDPKGASRAHLERFDPDELVSG